MSLDIIPNGDAVQQRDVGSISFIPLLGVAVSLLPSPKGMSIDIVDGDAVLVSILPTGERCFSSPELCPRFLEPTYLLYVYTKWRLGL